MSYIFLTHTVKNDIDKYFVSVYDVRERNFEREYDHEQIWIYNCILYVFLFLYLGPM